MRKNILIITLIVLIYGCTAPKRPASLTEGSWLGALTLNNDNKEQPIVLPFSFDVKKADTAYTITIHNAEETLEVKEISIKDDSVIIRMPLFDSEFRLQSMDGMLKGVWINHLRKEKNRIEFTAYPGLHERFKTSTTKNVADFSGRWEVLFSAGTADSSRAVGEFKQEGNHLTGTFLTETGDYRYLDGIANSNKLSLSCFDGSHAFLFTAKAENENVLTGDFWASAHHHEPWIAKRNEAAKLRNADSLTFLKKGFEKLEFSFPNTEGKTISLNDDRYKNKVVAVQIMGSWCPNCMDETKFLTKIYDEYNKQGLDVIALAFEKTTESAKATENVKRLKSHFHANYEFLITGKSGKAAVVEALPAIEKIMSFPTTIYIDKKGKVRKIYTGYYGPATGEHHTQFVTETKNFIEMLLKE